MISSKRVCGNTTDLVKRSSLSKHSLKSSTIEVVAAITQCTSSKLSAMMITFLATCIPTCTCTCISFHACD